MADENTDADANKLREILAKKIDRINDTIAKSEDKLRELQFDADSRKQDQRTSQVMDIAGGLLGGLLGGRRSTRSIITGGLRRSQSKGRMVARAEERVKTAENRYTEQLEDRDKLEDTLNEDLFEIQTEWSEKAGDIKSMMVGLERQTSAWMTWYWSGYRAIELPITACLSLKREPCALCSETDCHHAGLRWAEYARRSVPPDDQPLSGHPG